MRDVTQPPPEPQPRASVGPAWTVVDWWALGGLLAVAAALRLVGLDQPHGFVFDEMFYAQNACFSTLGGPACGLDTLVSRAHPPLGNWLIGAGIALFGYGEFGWRIAPALAGVLGVGATFLLTRRLLRGWAPGAATGGALAAGGLLALDPLHLVMSRVAMLDSFVTLFSVATIGFAVMDAQGARGRVGGRRRWRLAAGLALGAAVAVKWSGAYAGIGALALILLAEAAARRRDGEGRWAGFGRALRDECGSLLVSLGLVPVLVYLGSYIGFAHGSVLALPWQEGSWWREVAGHQVAMLRFHLGLEGSHPYESPVWSWLLLKRPVAFWFAASGGTYREVLALGNPVAWCAGVAGLLGVVVAARRDPRFRTVAMVAGVGAAATFLPWLVLSGSRSQVFIWYVLPTIPFLYIGLGACVAWAWKRGLGRAALGVAAAAVLAWFAFFWPMLTAQPLSPGEWRDRIWFSDCARPGASTLELPDDEINQGPPPSGWCWI